ncbi:fungal-specific transcription factor domain-containing protein [Cadophora sp. MPI-SDFR-AT-0126]|nr:fungal-specific transcription factor domain-containing protein [Leotiomycetes sp. MPI-SDFR-AT-0126]
MQNIASSTSKEKSTSPREAPVLNPRRAPKSRNGCLRCKAKRLKCDETKPGCQQCVKKNVTCPGYKSKSLVWSTKHEKMMGPNQDGSFHLPSTSNISAAGPSNPAPVTFENQLLNFAETSPQGEPEINTMPAIVTPGSPTIETGTRRDSNTATDSLSAIRQQLHRSTVPEFLLHLPTMLVEYYFSYVCQIFSSFDGTLNPFRSTVGRLWDGSAPIYYAIQSMAAAYLANHFPRMSPVGMQMQRETYRCLYQVPQGGKNPAENLDKTLLTVLLVGQTTAWHDPKDLGLVHLKTAKRLNRRRLEQQGAVVDNRARRQNEFFEQCILYWDMLAGFVEEDIDEFGFGEFEIRDTSPSTSPKSDTSEEGDKVFPHPWTGVAPKVQKLFAQVGRLIRSYRKSTTQEAGSLDFLSLDLGFNMDFPQDSAATIEATAKAQALEEELLAFEPPSACNLVDAGDENTPVHQYILLAESYKCAALLEIYRIFPSILFKRVPFTSNTFASSALDPAIQNLFPIPTTQPPSEFLVSLAIHTISVLEKLPSTSGTRCLQPIVILAAGSELRFSPASTADPMSGFMPATSSSLFNSLTNREVDIASARRFVTTRLQEFQLSLPAKPIVRALMLVQETWARADLGQDVFWMDVMDEMGWKTIFG